MWNYVLIGICALVGAAFSLAAVRRVIGTIVLLRTATRAKGRVVRLSPARNSDGHTLYQPVVEYRTNDGRVYQHTSTVASHPPAFKIGETATVLYFRKNPQNARIRSFTELWLLDLVFGIIGASCLTIAVAFAYSLR